MLWLKKPLSSQVLTTLLALVHGVLRYNSYAYICATMQGHSRIKDWPKKRSQYNSKPPASDCLLSRTSNDICWLLIKPVFLLLLLCSIGAYYNSNTIARFVYFFTLVSDPREALSADVCLNTIMHLFIILEIFRFHIENYREIAINRPVANRNWLAFCAALIARLTCCRVWRRA